MRTQFVTSKESADAALRLSKDVKAVNENRPARFQKVMRENRGAIGMFSYYGPSKDGLERKNPLIVALGDSVTAGHFEFTDDIREIIRKTDAGLMGENDASEVTDVRNSYVEQFREMLIDKYEQTSLSVVNSGIAGDTILGMQKRLYRDVVRYQPDLVIINASLNWSDQEGADEDFERALSETIHIIKEETRADIILLTPNMEKRLPYLPAPTKSTLDSRVNIIRKLAVQEEVCLADAYKVWEAYKEQGYPVSDLLANGTNHPSVTGHTLYANVLMQLFDETKPMKYEYA